MPVNFHIHPDYSGSVVRPVNRQRDNAKRSDENQEEIRQSSGWWTVAALDLLLYFPIARCTTQFNESSSYPDS